MKSPSANSLAGNSRDSFNSTTGSTRRLTLLVVVAVLLLNLLFLTKNYYWDGVFFSQAIEDARSINSSLIHPSHLLDQLFVYFVYRAVVWSGIHARALTVFQVSNCVLSAVAAAIVFRICARLFKSTYVSLVAAAMFAFSATWWKFSADADAYILAVLLLLACFYFLLPERRPRTFLVAILHAAAMLIHQLSMFFFPVALVGILIQTRGRPRHERALELVRYGATVTAITLIVYYATFRMIFGPAPVSRFVSWITYFSPEHGFTFSVWGNFIYSVRSQWRVFFGGRVAFIRDFSNFRMYALAAIAASLAIAFLVVTFGRVRELKGIVSAAATGAKRFRELAVLCIVWIVPYVIFLFFFIPQNTFYRLLYLPAIVLLIGAFMAAAESRLNHVRRYRAALFAAAMCAANLAFLQYPYSQARANPPLQLAMKLNQAWPAGTTIYFSELTSDNSLVKYFNPGTVWIATTPEELRQRLSSRSNAERTLWIDTTIMDRVSETAEGKRWLESHAITQPQFELVNSKYRIRFAQLRP